MWPRDVTARPAGPGAMLVWIVWGTMTAALIACIVLYTYNLPLAEDWHLVPPMTGHEPHLWQWLWAQNNEHRLPLPRLVLLGVLQVTGDFRAGMLANVLLMALAAFALVRGLAAMRGGRILMTDAFIPIALLHIGNWENFMWAWQLCFVLSAALTLVLLVAIAGRGFWTSPSRPAAAGLSVAALPLCGANGLAFAAPVCAWLTLEAVQQWRLGGARRQAGWWVLGGAGVALLVTAYYFVGYTRATWNPDSPGMLATLKTALKFLALGFGPVVVRAPGPAALALLAVLVPASWLVLQAALTKGGDERQRALRLLSYGGGAAGLALAFGWGRAGLLPTVGLPDRYVLLAVPAIIWGYYAMEIYARPGLRRRVQTGLLIAACALLPWNTKDGFEWRDWYRAGMEAVLEDLRAGLPRDELVERHGGYLMHWSPDRLSVGMLMLRDARIGPFAMLNEPVTSAAVDMR